MKGNILQKTLLMLVALTAAMALAVTPLASASSVTCRTGTGCLNGTDHFDWTANYGAPFSDIPNDSTATSKFGNTALVNLAGGDGERRDQGNGWIGNFAPGMNCYGRTITVH